jgi:pyridoxamine 5'-phosphate oxidase family protein
MMSIGDRANGRHRVTFTDKEMEYLRSQRLGRLATVAADGQPDNAAVGYRVADDGVITIDGMDIAASRKGRNVRSGNERIAFIVDDLETIEPWRPRGIRVYGRAVLLDASGEPPHGGYLRVTPEVSWSWGIEASPTGARGFTPHRTVHTSP